MSQITRLETGTRMSQAVIHNGIVYLAGQVGTEGADIAEQTRSALAKVDRILGDLGIHIRHIRHCRGGVRDWDVCPSC